MNDMAVTQVEPEQISIGGLIERALVTAQTLGCLPSGSVRLVEGAPISLAPMPDSADGYIADLGILPVKDAQARQH